jgi:hypothetical protein
LILASQLEDRVGHLGGAHEHLEVSAAEVAIAPAAASRCCCASRRWTTATAPAPRGAQAILLGCTEIDLAGRSGRRGRASLRRRVHAEKAVELACEPLRAL